MERGKKKEKSWGRPEVRLKKRSAPRSDGKELAFKGRKQRQYPQKVAFNYLGETPASGEAEGIEQATFSRIGLQSQKGIRAMARDKKDPKKGRMIDISGGSLPQST